MKIPVLSPVVDITPLKKFASLKIRKKHYIPFDCVTRPRSGSLRYMFRNGVWQLGTLVLKI